MYKQIVGLVMSFFASTTIMAEPIKGPPTENGCPAALNFTMRKLGSEESVNFCEAFKDKVVLIVNTASKCGFTNQYAGLEQLYSEYQDKGLVVVGFPSNDFANQEPGNEKEIKEFCRLTFGVKFPMFEKVHAAQDNASPIYKTLGDMAGEYPKWNFHKYLLNTKGELIGSFSGFTKPDDEKLVSLIKENLPKTE